MPFGESLSTTLWMSQICSSNPGRVLDTAKIMERVFDLEGGRILLKARNSVICGCGVIFGCNHFTFPLPPLKLQTTVLL